MITRKEIIDMVLAEDFDKVFMVGYENGIVVCEDWQEIDGKEYYVISVEDDVFKFEID